MTARASTPEYSCSSCRGLVLRGDVADAPACSDCARVICDGCQLSGLCVACFQRRYAPPLEALDDERGVQLVLGLNDDAECGEWLPEVAG